MAIKTEMGSCTPRSRSARWGAREFVKWRSNGLRRMTDRTLVENELEEMGADLDADRDLIADAYEGEER